MKLVKEYLEKRIEELKENAEIETYSMIRHNIVFELISDDLELVLTLFNEEYEKQNIILNSINDKLTDINKAISPKQTN